MSDEKIKQKRNELRAAMSELGLRIKTGDESQLLIWVLPAQLAVAHRPLRHDPEYGGSRRSLPVSASPKVVAWVDRIIAEGIRSVISLMHPKEIAHYSALDLGAPDLLAYYTSRGLVVQHLPWDDPAHRPAAQRASFEDELLRVRSEALTSFIKLPKPVLLHCSAGIDRSSPVAAYIVCNAPRAGAG